MIDLHIHTHYSDGRFSPADVIYNANKSGLRYIAITDHDNTGGLREALPLADQAGIELINGIEITSCWPEANLSPEDADVDVLGYGFDITDTDFNAFQSALFNDIRIRIVECCARLTAAGYPITLDDVLVHNPRYPGSLHTVQALQRKCHARGWGEAINLFTTYWFEGRKSAHSIQSVIAAIHAAGGAAVLAHPSIVRPNGNLLSGLDMRALVDMGLDGVEVYHHRLDAFDRAHFSQLAQEFDLVVTGGSDLHGWRDGFKTIGQEPLEEKHLLALRQACAKWQNHK